MQKTGNNTLNFIINNLIVDKSKSFDCESLFIDGDGSLLSYYFHGNKSELFIHLKDLIANRDKRGNIISFSVRGFPTDKNQFETCEDDKKSKMFYLNKSQINKIDKRAFGELCRAFISSSQNKCSKSIINFPSIIANNSPKFINKNNSSNSSNSSSSKSVRKCSQCPNDSLEGLQHCSKKCALQEFNDVQPKKVNVLQFKKCKGCGNNHLNEKEFCSDVCISRCRISSSSSNLIINNNSSSSSSSSNLINTNFSNNLTTDYNTQSNNNESKKIVPTGYKCYRHSCNKKVNVQGDYCSDDCFKLSYICSNCTKKLNDCNSTCEDCLSHL